MLNIVIPVHNSASHLEGFLRSLSAQAYQEYRCIVVDDGSSDGTRGLLRQAYPDVVVLEGDGNLYWGGAVNVGLAWLASPAAGVGAGDMVALANPDVRLERDTVRVLVNHWVAKPDTLYHPLVYDQSHTCVSSGARIISWPLFITRHPFRGQPADTVPTDRALHEVHLATARLLVLGANLVLGGTRIDSVRFRHYGGDNDLSLSLRKQGVKTYLATDARCCLDTAHTGANPGRLKSAAEFRHSLSDVRSTNNIGVRLRLGLKHCPPGWLPFYIASVLAQVVVLNTGLRRRAA